MTILSTLIGLFAALSLSQQTTDKLAFMEIPLGEPLYQFSAQLENKGLTLVDADFGKGYSMFSGSYESHPDCSIVANSDTEGNVKEVTVMVKAKTKGIQAIVKEVYEPLKKSLSQQYGVPAVKIEDFSGRERDIRKRLKAGESATCEYIVPGGVVLLTISYDALVGGYFAVVVYSQPLR